MSGVTTADVNSAIAAALTGYAKTSDVNASLAPLQAGMAQFVNNGLSQTVDELLANFPAAANVRGKYARVSDYGGAIDRVLRCDYASDIQLHYWMPTQPEFGKTMAVTGNSTLFALKSPTIINLTGTIALGVTRSFTLDPANRRPGETVEIKYSSMSILGSLNLIGTGIGTLLINALGGYLKFMFDGQGVGQPLALVRIQ
jgi:hypothetical protein